MKNQINISAPDSRKSRQNFVRERFLPPLKNPGGKNPEVKSQKILNPVIYDWQVTDYEPEQQVKEQYGNLYVADWEMVR